MKFSFLLPAVLAFLSLSLQAGATIRLSALFQSNMVLQRDKPCSIWGTANKGEKVSLLFNDHTYTTTGDKSGNWLITLPSQTAGGPYTITLSGTNTITLNNVLFGDVWLCGGQSNMQFKVSEMNNKTVDTSRYNNAQIRIITIPTAIDYVPQDTVKGGTWKVATAANVQDFSAVGFFFGEYVNRYINVPIGLISDNLGGTAVETWMSPGAIKAFPQFAGFYNNNIAPGKSFKQLQDAFDKYKPEWNKKYYLANDPGLTQQWYLPQTDTSDWKQTKVLSYWEDNILPDYDGSVWFRRSFSLPTNYDGKGVGLGFGTIDDYVMIWVNGKKIAEGYGNLNIQGFSVPDSVLQKGSNTLVLRIFDAGNKGGIPGFWWFPQWTTDTWLYKPGVKIDAAKFVKPAIPNANLTGSPTILYNANIAPVTKLAIKGVIWYQGESNADRAEEYKQLFPAFIKDWRTQFKQGDFPFLFVQLANYDNNNPDGLTYPELREAQASALSLPNTGIATAIDIGEAKDIHPKNKTDVGKRLGIAAMKVAYGQDSTHLSPAFKSYQINSDSIIVQVTEPVFTKDKYGYIRGFSIVGSDSVFHLAKAYLNNGAITVYSAAVSHPAAVRYAWANNPGELDLYSKEDLPLLPFRTDNWKDITSGKKYVFTE